MSSPYKSKVYFFFQQKKIFLKNRNPLKLFIEQIFKKEGKKLDEINYIFCSDKQLLEINRKYLRRDYYTDIITFDLSDETNSIKAESYISVDRAKENAKNLGVSIQSEVLRVIFHGALHLCGYNDKSKKGILLMRNKEDYYLSLFGKSI